MMDGNKLKHKFVKKEKQTNDWARRTYPMGTIDGVNVNYEQPSRFETWSPIEEVVIERVVGHEVLNKNNLERGIVKEVVKKDMAKELAQLLLENGFIESIEVINPTNFSTKIKMKIKVKKLI